MEKLKERITENGIDHILVGDYYILDLKLPEENRPIGGTVGKHVAQPAGNRRCHDSCGIGA